MEEQVVSVGFEDIFSIVCPYCMTQVELYLDPTSNGTLVEDCEVCCRPWEINVGRDADGVAHLSVGRA